MSAVKARYGAGPMPSTTSPSRSLLRTVATRDDSPLNRTQGNAPANSPSPPSAPLPADRASTNKAPFLSRFSRPAGGVAPRAPAAPASFGRTTGSITGLPSPNFSFDSAAGSFSGGSKFLIPPLRSTDDALLSNKDASPAHRQTYTVVWDLDETLVSNRGPGRALLRPGAIEVLKALAALNSAERPVELVLWTASVESLARQVLTQLDPQGVIFQHLIFRDRRWFKETGYTKDLRLLGRDMDRVVIIENSPFSVTLNRSNAILVKDYMGHAPHDTDLKAVREVLEGWIQSDEFIPIRTFLSQHPKVDKANHIIAMPSVPTIAGGLPRSSSVGGRRVGGFGGGGWGRRF